MQVKPEPRGNDVVVIGYEIIAPTGSNRDEFSNSLFSGKTAIQTGQFPELENVFEHTVPTAPVKNEQINALDESNQLDRTKNFVDHCLENFSEFLSSIYKKTKTHERGVFAATSKGGILVALNGNFRDSVFFHQLFCHDIASHLANMTNSTGPCQSYVGACATSLQNLIQAKFAIQDHLCEVAFVASSEASLHPLYLSSFINLKAYAETGCYPFDKKHEGFVAGEGAAIIALTRRRWAEENGFQPLAKIEGHSARSDAFHAVAINTTGENIAACGLEAIQRSNLSPELIDMVQAHGTATAGNDTAESNAIQKIWQNKKIPWVHGLKGATGHLMGAAGIIELVTCLEILKLQQVPETAGFSNHFQKKSAMNLATRTERAKIQHILKWSFGFGGHLAAVVLTQEQN